MQCMIYRQQSILKQLTRKRISATGLTSTICSHWASLTFSGCKLKLPNCFIDINSSDSETQSEASTTDVNISCCLVPYGHI